MYNLTKNKQIVLIKVEETSMTFIA